MKRSSVSALGRFSAVIEVPGDKSISHRAVILGSLARGKTVVRHFLEADDCLRTADAFRKMGVEISKRGSEWVIRGKGLWGLRKPSGSIYLGNSGTSMRLLLGVLAGQPFRATLTGDSSLSRRPMSRVVDPLMKMGASVAGGSGANHAPLTIQGGTLYPVRHTLAIPSAQVKSALLLAGLYPEGETGVREPIQTRDHTERIFPAFGKKVKKKGHTVSVIGGKDDLRGTDFYVPGDPSSAAFFVVLAALSAGSDLLIRRVGLNPTRTHFLEVLKRMKAKIEIHVCSERSAVEPWGDLFVRGASRLQATRIRAEEVVSLIDELPVLMVASAAAEGLTVIQGASELRVKETDRIASMVTNLSRMGVDIRNRGDNLYIRGGNSFKASKVKSFGDHRTAMSCLIAGCLAEGKTTVEETACIQTSFPSFFSLLKSLSDRKNN